MRFVMKAFSVDFVDVFRSGRTRRKPAAARSDFNAADGRVIAGRLGQDLFDRFPGNLRYANLLPVKFAELGFLLRGSRGVDSIGKRRAQFLRERAILLTGISSGARGDFRRQQCRYDAVLIRGPRLSVDTAERSTGAFFAAKAQFSIHKSCNE